jgi:hypothetical protein
MVTGIVFLKGNQVIERKPKCVFFDKLRGIDRKRNGTWSTLHGS